MVRTARMRQKRAYAGEERTTPGSRVCFTEHARQLQAELHRRTRPMAGLVMAKKRRVKRTGKKPPLRKAGHKKQATGRKAPAGSAAGLRGQRISMHRPAATQSLLEGATVMAVKLYKAGFEHAKKRVSEGQAVIDDRDAWSDHQPTTQEENAFINACGIAEYAKWHLGVDDEKPKDTKGHYKFPYGDFKKVHRCAILTAESRAGQYNYLDIERAAAHLHGMIEELARIHS
jgi:hypothetical protein